MPAPLLLLSALCTLWLAGHLLHDARARTLLVAELQATRARQGCDAPELRADDDPTPEVLRLVRARRAAAPAPRGARRAQGGRPASGQRARRTAALTHVPRRAALQENTMRDQGVLIQRLQNAAREKRARSDTLSAAKASLRGEGAQRKLLAFVGVSSHPSRGALRSALRAAWFPTGDALARLEAEQGIVLRFVLGQAPPDKAVGDFTEVVRAAGARLRGARLGPSACGHARMAHGAAWRRQPG